MKYRQIGNRTVSAIGLGAMPMSFEGRPERSQSIETIAAAIDSGVTFLDTANTYHTLDDAIGHNEVLVAEGLKAAGASFDDVLVATKGGRYRAPDGSFQSEGKPEQLKAAAKASAKRLDVDTIGLYQFHRPDVDIPYAESIGALRDLLDEGVIAMAGISNVNVEQIDIANEVLGGRLASVQNRFSPIALEHLPELKHCAELGIAFLPYAPVGGRFIARAELDDQWDPFKNLAAERGISVFQAVLAWTLSLTPQVIPIPGASKPSSIIDSAGAADLVLTSDELATLPQVN
jgi:aryl-alcohol dehydrogenase-like predicted oxidoreductase